MSVSTSALEWSVPIILLLCGLALVSASLFDFPTKKWGAGLCILGIGYGCMLFRTTSFSAAKPLGEDFLILVSVAICCRAFTDRFRIRGSLVLEAIFVGAAIGAATLSLQIYRSVRLETLSVLSFSAALVFICILRVRNNIRNQADIISALSFSIIFFILLSQSITYIFLVDEKPLVGQWSSSIWGAFIQYTAVVGSIILAFASLLSGSLDKIEQFRTQSNTDPLTNLFNRRGFMSFTERQRFSRLASGSAVVILADIDHFKSVNDRFGHQNGDMVLVAFAEILRKHAGKQNCVARLGGEEFIALLLKTSVEDALAVAEAIRQELRERRWSGVSDTLKVTVSIGVTELQIDEPLSSAISRADNYLYWAKRDGRDRLIDDDAMKSIAVFAAGD